MVLKVQRVDLPPSECVAQVSKVGEALDGHGLVVSSKRLVGTGCQRLIPVMVRRPAPFLRNVSPPHHDDVHPPACHGEACATRVPAVHCENIHKNSLFRIQTARTALSCGRNHGFYGIHEGQARGTPIDREDGPPVECHFMRFGVRDVVLTLGCFSAVLVLAVGTFLLSERLLTGRVDAYAPILTVVATLLSIPCGLVLLLRGLQLFFPYREGTFPVDDSPFMVSWKYYQLSHDFLMGPLGYTLPVSLRSALYRVLGAKLGPGVMIAGKLVEPPLIEIEREVFTGENSLLTAHAIESGVVTLEKIVVREHATVGALAIVLPGVEIGEHAIVAAGALVAKGTKIGPREIWGGIPARKIGERPPST